jgi:hypothetical protein
MQHTYESLFETSTRANWKVEDVIGDRKLDFSKPFLPESLVQVDNLSFLTPQEKLKLNQIRGHEYLSMFELAEESIVPHLMEQAQPIDWSAHGRGRIRALLGFCGEEAKHIHVFKRFREEFNEGFASPCEFVGPVDDITRFVLSHSALAVALMAHHFEHMTLGHYVESVKDNQDLDPQFKRLLKFHWIEESQHVKIGTLMIESMVERATSDEIDLALAEYQAISLFLDDVIRRQTQFDCEAFERATGRSLEMHERAEMTGALLQGMRWTYIGSALANPNFLATLETVKPGAEVVPSFST